MIMDVKGSLTVLYQKRGQTRNTSDHHTHTQSPSPPEPLHGGPQKQISWQLNNPSQKEVEELVSSQNGCIVGQANIYTCVCEPYKSNYDSFLPQIRCPEQVQDAIFPHFRLLNVVFLFVRLVFSVELHHVVCW